MEAGGARLDHRSRSPRSLTADSGHRDHGDRVIVIRLVSTRVQVHGGAGMAEGRSPLLPHLLAVAVPRAVAPSVSLSPERFRERHLIVTNAVEVRDRSTFAIPAAAVKIARARECRKRARLDDQDAASGIAHAEQTGPHSAAVEARSDADPPQVPDAVILRVRREVHPARSALVDRVARVATSTRSSVSAGFAGRIMAESMPRTLPAASGHSSARGRHAWWSDDGR